MAAAFGMRGLCYGRCVIEESGTGPATRAELARSALDVAPRLLGSRLTHRSEEGAVTVRITEVAKRFARGDVAEVLEPSPERVVPPCPNAGVCGGCDFQHVRPEFQAELKRRVLAEQLQRLAGIHWDGVVEQVPPVLGSRTRMRFVATTRSTKVAASGSCWAGSPSTCVQPRRRCRRRSR